MRKWLALALVWAMILSCPALAAEGDVYVSSTDSEILTDTIRSICAMGDTLWMASYNMVHLYAHRVGDTEPTAYPLPNASAADEDLPDTINQNPSLMTDGERLMLLDVVSDYTWSDPEYTGTLYEVVQVGDEVTLEPICDVDISPFIRGGYFSDFSAVVGLKTCALLKCYEGGERQGVYRMDYETGQVTRLDVQDITSMCAWRDGLALMQQYSDAGAARMLSYDPQTNAIETVGSFEMTEVFPGMAWNEADQTLYFARRGEVFPLDPQSGAIGEPVCDMPLEGMSYSMQAVVLDGGWYASYDLSSYAVRSLSGGTDGVKLRVYDGSWSDTVVTAWQSFNKSHSDVSVILNRDALTQSLVDAMMNQDSSVDVYVMFCFNEEFEAVRSRGYMADLSVSEKLSALYARMSEEGKGLCTTDAGFSMIPLSTIFSPIGFRTEVLEEMGMTQDDVPDNWQDMLTWIHTLEGRLPEGVTLMDPFYSVQDIRYLIVDKIFSDYQLVLADNPNGITSQQMFLLLQSLDAIDFRRLGAVERSEDEDMFNYDYDESKILMNMDNFNGLAKLTYNWQPHFLSLTPTSPKFISLSTSVAFINPYTQHMDEALAFIEALADNLNEEILYTLCEDLNEPTLNPYHDETLQLLQQELDSLRVDREFAEAADVQSIDDQITLYEQYVEEAEADVWNISAEDIAWLRSHDGQIVLEHYPWLYSKESGEAMELVNQYVEGQINPQVLMNEIDRKIRMMILEGM